MAYFKFTVLLFFFFMFQISCNPAISTVQAKQPVEPVDVYYAGVCYLGSYAYIGQNYPVALELNTGTKNKPVGQLDAVFSKLVNQVSPRSLRIKKELADLRAGQSLTMALAIDSEYVSLENIGGYLKIVAEISGQLLFFDFSKMVLVANYPIIAAKNHVADANAKQAVESKKLLTQLYIGTGGNSGFLRLAAQKLATVNVRENFGLRFQVANVDLSRTVVQAIPKTFTEQRVKQYIGQYMSARLALGYHISVLPFVKGYTIGNRMVGRFSNGEAYELALPEADYIFNLGVTNIKQQPYNNKDLLFAAQMRFILEEPRQRKEYINGLFHYGVPKFVAKNQTDIDAWAGYMDAMDILLDELVEQLGHPDKKWLKKHGASKECYGQFKTKKGLFNGK